MEQTNATEALTLGECLFDRSRGLLLRGGAPVPLRPKAFALLNCLADRSGSVVTKAELIDAVWPGIHVTEDSLTQAVREVRKALGDDEREILRTVAGRGYLLSPPAGPASAAMGLPTVAFLQFSRDVAGFDEVVADGIVEDIMNALARFRVVTVLARNSTFAFASAAAADWRGIGRQLGARFLVKGSLRGSAEQVRIDVSLIDAGNGAITWSETFHGAGSDLAAIQGDIAARIANRLASRLSDAQTLRGPAETPKSVDLRAYELLLRALARFRGYEPGDNEAAKALLEEAIALAPDYGLAHAYLALVDITIAEFDPDLGGSLGKTIERAAHGLTLAPEEPRCHRILGLLHLYAGEFVAAEHHLRRSLDLNPFDADAITQMGYALTIRGRPAEALTYLREAFRLNPFAPDWYEDDLSMALYCLGDYAGSIESLSKLASRAPWKLTRLAAAHAQAGDLATAGRLMAEAGDASGQWGPASVARFGFPFERAADAAHFNEGVAKAKAAMEAAAPRS